MRDHDRNAEAVNAYRKLFRTVNTEATRPPEWVIPGLLVPGLNLLVGEPKTFKSFLALLMISWCLNGNPVPGLPLKYQKIKAKKGPCVYMNGEQSIRSLKYIYETRVTRKKMQTSVKDWTWIMPESPLRWQLDAYDDVHDPLKFMEVWSPIIEVYDPLIAFHSLDENSPLVVKPLLPLKEQAIKIGGAIVVVHHLSKPKDVESAGRGDFNRIRGTGALWGAADGASILTKRDGGSVDVKSEFKEFKAHSWSFRPPSGDLDEGRE